MVSDKGGKFGYVVASRQNVYKALRRKGASESKAARIANAGASKAGRRKMSRKAGRSRKRRKR
jgi:uncharacterized protein (DUF302 family)